MTIEIPAGERSALIPLFAGCRHDRVLIDSTLEGYFGTAHADAADGPAVARLDSGAFTILAGDPEAAAVPELLDLAPIELVTPQSDGWRRVLEARYGDAISAQPFTMLSAASLDAGHLKGLVGRLSPPFELRPIDGPLAERLGTELGNETMIECFRSVDDFLARGLGYCILHQDRIASAATSMARSSRAIDIDIETAAGFRQQGLGTVVGAKLVLACLERGIEPCWLAANETSTRLALKLGYARGETYETLVVEEQ